jgi:CHRD domain
VLHSSLRTSLLLLLLLCCAGEIIVPLFGQPLQQVFTDAQLASGKLQGCAPLSTFNFLADIENLPEQYYANVHSGAHPEGAIRGQLA